MKIGILTFHNPNNYGALLQVYCLQSVIEREGHKVEVIDYRNNAIEERVRPFTFKQFIKNPIKFLIRIVNVYYWNRKQERKFDYFRNHELHLSKRNVRSVDIPNLNYDLIVIGSDQVWNPSLTGGYDPVYWGQYKPKGAKVISYAASSSIKEIEKADNSSIKDWLNSFDLISVREDALCRLIQPFTKKEVKVVLDPTLLAGSNVLETITAPRIINERYIFVYAVEATSGLWDLARFVSKKYNAKIVTAPMLALSSRLQMRDVKCVNASISELLSLIKYSECVIALSFHGTALSLLYHKDFYSFKGGNMTRVETILSEVNLMNRIVSKVDDVSFTPILYDKVDEKLNLLRKSSYSVLKSGLNIC